MKVVFVASHSQSDGLGKYYHRIIEIIKKHADQVFVGTLFDDKKYDQYIKDQKTREDWYKECLSQIRSCDVVVAEASYPSTANVGHELTYALDIGKPVIVLYHDGREPFFLRGRVDDKLTLLEYREGDLEHVLNDAFDYALTTQDVRFNFFISPQIGRYLDWISKKKRIPRAVYLRRLIEEDMHNSNEYNEGSDE